MPLRKDGGLVGAVLSGRSAVFDKRGLTIEQLAEAAGVGGRQPARVEAGRASPSLLWL